MKNRFLFISLIILGLGTLILNNSTAGTTSSKDNKKKCPAVSSTDKKATDKAVKNDASDTLEITARLIEIPGKFPPNDLYNYVYIMKYRVIKVIKGKYSESEILVGHYNPRIPRKQINDKMDNLVDGRTRYLILPC